MLGVLSDLLGCSISDTDIAGQVATLPARLGGLGLRSAKRTAVPAFWASWADALPMLSERVPALTASLILELQKPASPVPIVRELTTAASELSASGFHCLPAWEDLQNGARPESIGFVPEPGEWAHGWQYHASSTCESFHRRRVVLPSCSPTEQALLRSQSGPGSGFTILGCPTLPEFTFSQTHFRCILLRRLQLPLPLTEYRCEGCGGVLDPRGHHRAACVRSGRLKKRAIPLERATARVCREAGAIVREGVKLRDLNLAVPAGDEREIEVLASGLPCRAGAQIAVGATIRSPLSSSGAPHARAAREDAVTADSARQDKEATHLEFSPRQRCVLVVLALEVGGRFSGEAYRFVEELAFSKAQEAPPAVVAAALVAPAGLLGSQGFVRLCAAACRVAAAAARLWPRAGLARSRVWGHSRRRLVEPVRA